MSLMQRSAQDMSEALRYTPGAVVDQWRFEGCGYEYLLLRGFQGLTISLFCDDLSMVAQGLYSGSFITDTYGLECVDVLRRPTSVTFGWGDAGGNLCGTSNFAAPIASSTSNGTIGCTQP